MLRTVPLRLLPRSATARLCVLLWLMVITADILRATYDAFEDATTPGLPAKLGAAALAVSAWTVIRIVAGDGPLPPARRALRFIAMGLWLAAAAILAMRNTGGHHPADYLLGFLFVTGTAAATATICLAILATNDRDKARLIRALARTTEQNASQLQHHLAQARSASLPRGR